MNFKKPLSRSEREKVSLARIRWTCSRIIDLDSPAPGSFCLLASGDILCSGSSSVYSVSVEHRFTLFQMLPIIFPWIRESSPGQYHGGSGIGNGLLVDAVRQD